MAFIRACSYSCTIKPPKDPAEYSAALLTIAQDGVNLINKDLADLEISGANYILTLTQQETKMFAAGTRAWMQIRCFISDSEVDGHAPWPIDVFPALNDQIIGGE